MPPARIKAKRAHHTGQDIRHTASQEKGSKVFNVGVMKCIHAQMGKPQYCWCGNMPESLGRLCGSACLEWGGAEEGLVQVAARNLPCSP